MSVMQQLRESGLFRERPPQGNGSVCFATIGWQHASVYAQGNDREVHITVSAFRNHRFPNSDRLHEFVCSHSHGMAHGVNPNRSYRLDGEHVPEVIEIIRSGL